MTREPTFENLNDRIRRIAREEFEQLRLVQRARQLRARR